MKKIHIFGDSHVWFLNKGWKAIRSESDYTSDDIEFYGQHGANWFQFRTSVVNDGLKFYSNVAAEVCNNPEIFPVDYSLGSRDDLYIFSSLLHSCTVYRDPTWHQFCPWECLEKNPDLHAVSTSLIELWSCAQAKVRLDMLRAVKERGYSIAVVEPPKPLSRVPGMWGLRPDILLAADRIYRNFVMRNLGEIGIPVIEVPSHTHERGFTTPKYSAPQPDPHHGSEMFAAEMMRLILDFGATHSTSVCTTRNLLSHGELGLSSLRDCSR
jgi:hypothetical protein